MGTLWCLIALENVSSSCHSSLRCLILFSSGLTSAAVLLCWWRSWRASAVASGCAHPSSSWSHRSVCWLAGCSSGSASSYTSRLSSPAPRSGAAAPPPPPRPSPEPSLLPLPAADWWALVSSSLRGKLQQTPPPRRWRCTLWWGGVFGQRASPSGSAPLSRSAWPEKKVRRRLMGQPAGGGRCRGWRGSRRWGQSDRAGCTPAGENEK